MSNVWTSEDEDGSKKIHVCFGDKVYVGKLSNNENVASFPVVIPEGAIDLVHKWSFDKIPVEFNVDLLA